jgi:ribose 5-phosphate isomerase B
LCVNTEYAELSRRHNDANILCLPARFMAFEHALQVIDVWLCTDFEGGRHARRVMLIENGK